MATNSYDAKIWPLADSSGYFVFGLDNTSYIANLCKYTFSSNSAQCQSMANIKYGNGQLMVSQTQFFVLGVGSSAPNDLYMYKVTFSNTSLDWANKIACSGTCSSNIDSTSDSILSLDGLTIYSFILFGSPSNYYLYFASMLVSTGGVIGTRFKSSVTVGYVYTFVINEEYLIVPTESPSSIIIYNLASSAFTIKAFAGNYILGLAIELSTGRFIAVGKYSPDCYITKFTIPSIDSNSDFSADSWSMNTLSAGTNDIVSEIGVIIGAATSISISTNTYTNQSVTYVQGATTTSNVYYQILTESFSVVEGNSASFTPSLSCSFDGTTPIAYSLSSYGSLAVPSWVSINSSTGVLTITTSPSVSSNTEFDFYVTSTVSGVASPVHKLIKLTVTDNPQQNSQTQNNSPQNSQTQNCKVQNCQQCSNIVSSICTVCASGYTLNSGVCNAGSKVSSTAQLLGISVTASILVISCITILGSIIDTSSISNLWSIVNQSQMLFLFLLLKSYIPEDVKTVIKGPSFTINIYSYIPISNVGIINKIFFDFKSPLTDSSLGDFNINSDSSIYNLYPMFICVFLLMLMHVSLYFAMKCIVKIRETGCCKWSGKIMKRVLIKLYNIMTFGFYIRNCLEMLQFILVSSIHEISKFNTVGSFDKISVIFAILLLLFFCIFICIIVYLIFTSYKINEESHNKFEEFFNGIKESKTVRFFMVVLLAKNCLYIALMFLLESISSKVLIGILCLFQLSFIIYIIFLRPFETKKTNIIQIINDVYYFILLITLAFLNEETDWSSMATSTYIWVLSSNSMIVFLIVCVDGVRAIILWVIRKCLNGSTQAHARAIRNTVIRPSERTIVHKSKTRVIQSVMQRQKGIQKLNIPNLQEESKFKEEEDNSLYNIIKIKKTKDWS